ncbi:unnamed protein product [Eruca vesicaria subsp. sativa]|uniref:Uncharacterized protein n=1 Tax=Eruca vesicaria subsp. sativa TaxID=29727 RepID=A0ABC8K327_ERUVS|nr:unnamed protein product [Eruca vesicaria subsp. sativa]
MRKTVLLCDAFMQCSPRVVLFKHRRIVAVHPQQDEIEFQFQRVVCRCYYIEGDLRYLLHYRIEDMDNAYHNEEVPAIPLQSHPQETSLGSRSFLEPALTSQLKTLTEELLLTEQAARRSVIRFLEH